MRKLMGKMQRLAVVATMLAVAGSAWAQSKPDLEAAKSAFKAGQQFLQMERYGDAIVEFNKAYAITKDGLVMGQVALGYEKAGDYESALSAIRIYREALPPSDRGSVDALIKKYNRLIAQGRSKKLVLPGEKPQDQATAAPGAAPQSDGPTPPPEDEPSGAKKGRFWTWIAAGTAAALGVAAVAVGLSAKSKYDELDDRCGEGQVGFCSDDDVSSVETRAVVTDVLWPMALAAGITAGVLFFIEAPPKTHTMEETDDLLDDEELEDDLVKSWRVTPVAGSGVYGLGAELTY